MILAAIAKVILNWTLTAMPAFGIMGAAWATAADMGVAAFINLYFIYKYIGYKMELGQLFKTIISAAIMAAVVKIFYDFTIAEFSSEIFSTFGAIFVGCLIYIAATALTGGLLKSDMERIPMVGKFGVRFFTRIGIFKD